MLFVIVVWLTVSVSPFWINAWRKMRKIRAEVTYGKWLIQASKQAHTHSRVQWSHISVGLTQARPSYYSIGIVHNDIQEVCGSTRLVKALVVTFVSVQWGSVTLLASYLKYLSAVDESAFSDLLGEVHGHTHNCWVQAHSSL